MKEIKIAGRTLAYRVKYGFGSRRLRLAVSEDAGLEVTLPKNGSIAEAEKFLREKAGWIFSRLDEIEELPPRALPPLSEADFKKYRFRAWELAHSRLDEYKKIYGLSFNRVSIKKQSSLWGSCSKKGNLNFNYRIVFLPSELQDYLIVHEICHLVEMNHSKKFWQLVEKTVPDYRLKRKKLMALR